MEIRKYIHKFDTVNQTDQGAILHILSGGHYTCDHSFFENNYYKSGYYLIYVESGLGYLETEQKKQLLNAHTMFLIDLSKPYQYYAHKTEPWVIHWILFDGATAGYLAGRIFQDKSNLFTLEPDHGIYRMFMSLLDCYFNLPFQDRNRILFHRELTCLLCEIIQQKGALSLKGNEQQKYPDPIRMMISYIEQNYFRKITLDELAGLTYLNKYYMARLFKLNTGLAVCEFINKFRLEYSRQLLLSDDLAIEQVALNLGFHSHSYFTKCFKREYGLTPKEYIEQSRV